MRWLQASAISRPPPSAAPLIAATTGRGNVSSRRRPAFMDSTIAKISGASSLVAWLISLRLPPAKNVFFALATTTPVTWSCSSYSRSTAAAIETRYRSFMVLALDVGSSRVRVTIPASSRS
jgi:hypothetical protein